VSVDSLVAHVKATGRGRSILARRVGEAEASRLLGEAPAPASAPPRPPGLLRKAATLARAVTRHVAAGLPAVPPEVKAQRLALCQVCPDLRPNGNCGRCGCVVAVKTGWALEECPAGKW
jgi:hypothetical protein